MKYAKLILTFLFGVFIIFGGVNHFLKPAMYFPFIPASMPQAAITYLSGVLEILVGIVVFIPKFRSYGTLGILALMIAFLPLHIIDVFSETPAIGSHQATLIRLPVQFLFILWAWYIHKK
jgi:uncharacterized membrane protein